MCRRRCARRLVRVLILGVALAGFAPAQDGRAQADSRSHLTAELVSESDAIVPGARFLVALRLVADPDWHIYWRNPGDAGSPPSLTWSLPPGFRAGPILWPVPRLVPEPPLAAYGYEGEALFLTEIEAPPGLRPGQVVPLAAHASWVVCKVDCIAGEADLARRVRVSAPEATPDRRWSGPLRAAFAALPRPVPEWRVSAVAEPAGYRLRLEPTAGRGRSPDSVIFFAAAGDVIRHAAPQLLARDRDVLTLALARSEYAAGPATRLAGLLVATPGWDVAGAVPAMEVDVPVAPAQVAMGASPTLWLALVLAFLGGILLNLMPCVFPVVSLKVLGFASLAAEGRQRAWHHGLAFAAGVVAAFWALAAALLVVRGAGGALGWGFQLQSPAFVAVMALLMVAIGLNLLGALDVGSALTRLAGVAPDAPRLTASFGTGVLATVVATPCTAPFMGVAVGFSLTQPAASALLVFTLLGLGMAAPYALLAASPRLRTYLPRPGAWMETFRQAMAFPLFATAAWLVWVLAQQSGAGAVLRVLIGMTLLALAAWVLGRWNPLVVSARARAASRTAATLAATTALLVAIPPSSVPAPPNRPAWERYSAQRVADLQRAGRIVFVDFTAAWCLTCMVNERVALDAAPVRERFRELDVATLKADWTSRDPRIAEALASFGRNSVPLYVLHHRDARVPPTILPTVLTPSIVLAALDAAQ